MPGTVWFGTRDYMQWVPAPAVDVTAGKVGFTGSANFLNGGAWVRRSKASSKQFSFSWNMRKRADIQPILDYADGLFGDGPIYYVNPFAADRNMLPAYWASPFMNAYDGPLRVDGSRPTITTEAVTNGYPLESANWAITTTSTGPSIFLPVPPGHTVHIGAHGQAVSGASTVTVQEFVGNVGGAVQDLTLLNKAASPTNWTSAGTTTGVVISLKATVNGTLRLHGIIVQMLPTGAVSPVGGFVSGQGQSGMSFVSQPSVSEYSAALDRVGVSADLVETEAWS